jgi:hypothetical protein
MVNTSTASSTLVAALIDRPHCEHLEGADRTPAGDWSEGALPPR